MKCHSLRTILSIVLSHCYFLFSDKIYLTLQSFLKTGKFINFNNPTLFGEKLQYLKINDRNSIYTLLVDKYRVKRYVSELLDSDCCIPTLGIWNSIYDIDFKFLPETCVLKCTHDSGSVLFYNKFDLEIERKLKRLQKSLSRNYYKRSKEWPYKNVSPRIIAEPLMSDGIQQELTDYKFFCFNGQPTFCQVIQNRRVNETIDFFDMDWNILPFSGLHKSITEKYPTSRSIIEKPFCFGEMRRMAEILSKNIPFVRIDLYEINRKVYFGEYTFFPMSGFGTFYPIEYNEVIGELIKLR